MDSNHFVFCLTLIIYHLLLIIFYPQHNNVSASISLCWCDSLLFVRPKVGITGQDKVIARTKQAHIHLDLSLGFFKLFQLLLITYFILIVCLYYCCRSNDDNSFTTMSVCDSGRDHNQSTNHSSHSQEVRELSVLILRITTISI